MPITIDVEYCGRWGYKPAYDNLAAKLSKELPDCKISGRAGRTSSFEVVANGQVLHSKLGGTGGKVESASEYKELIAKLKPLLGA